MKEVAEDEKDEVEAEITEVEVQVSDIVAETNRNKVIENFKSLSQLDGKMNTNNMWNLKRKVFPKNKESLPFAKKDCDGNLVSSHKQLKDLYLDTFIHRLRHRPIKEDFSYLKYLKEELCSRRLEYTKKIKTRDWTMEDLDKVLKSLKPNKSRYPHGFVNEIFKPGIIGFDLKSSL